MLNIVVSVVLVINVKHFDSWFLSLEGMVLDFLYYLGNGFKWKNILNNT